MRHPAFQSQKTGPRLRVLPPPTQETDDYNLLGDKNQAMVREAMSGLATRLRAARANEGLTQANVATLTGLSLETVRRMERGAVTTLRPVLLYLAALDPDDPWAFLMGQ